MTRRSRAMCMAAALMAALAGSAVAAADAASAAAGLIAKMPAKSPTEEKQLCAELFELGPAGIGGMCRMLVAPGKGDDTKARYALSALAAYVTRAGAQSERQVVADGVVQALASASDKQVKAFLIRQLQGVGTEAHVRALRTYLSDESLYEPATQAMLAIGGPGLNALFREALPTAGDANRITLLNALARCGTHADRDAIRTYAASTDVETRLAALHALARVGAPGDGDLLAKAAQVASPYERAKATSCYLLFARRIAPSNAGQAARICRDLIKTRTARHEANVQSAALATLVDALREEALGDLLAAMDGKNAQLQQAALNLASKIPGQAATARWVAKTKQLPPGTRAKVVDMLGRRGDASALPALLDALKAKDKGVRLAAIPAIGRLAGKDAVPTLLSVLETGQPDEVHAARDVLKRVPGDEMMAQAAAALATSPPPGRVALLEILAARHASAHLVAVFARTKDADGSVRIAAIRALANLASDAELARLIELMLEAKGTERSVARDVVVSVARQCPDPASHATKLLDVSRKADTPSDRDLALEACVRLTDAAALPADKKLSVYKNALAVAKRAAEKKLVLTGLGRIRSVPSLKLAAPYLDDAALQNDAAAAVVTIACPPKKGQPGLRGSEVVAALTKVVAVAKDAKIRKQAEQYLGTFAKPDRLNLAQGKPVKTSVPHQGNCTPEGAVDGNYKDNHAAWFGARWPSWLQVDLGKPVKIDTAHVYFYWDGRRSYQYNLQVSVDGKGYRTVVDMSKNTRAAEPAGVIHRFASTEARYVRINVLKNSVNEAVHLVELKIYGEGTGPTPPPPPPPKPDAEGFLPLFNGRDLTGWTGHTGAYRVQDGRLIGGGGLYYKAKEFSDFVFRFEFKLTPGSNSGIAIRSPMMGHAAYQGMEIQILDDTAERYKKLQPYQYHGSIYGVVAAKRGHLKPVGEWNTEEITAKGRRVTVKLNGVTIVDADIDKASTPRTADGKAHPGLKRAGGYLGIVGHGSHVEYRNIRIKELR